MLKALLAVVVRFAVPHRNLDLLENYAITMADPYHPEFGDTLPLDRDAVLDLIVDPLRTQAVLEHAETSGGTECDASLRDWVVCFYPANKCPSRGPAELVLLEAPHTHPGRQGNRQESSSGLAVCGALHSSRAVPLPGRLFGGQRVGGGRRVSGRPSGVVQRREQFFSADKYFATARVASAHCRSVEQRQWRRCGSESGRRHDSRIGALDVERVALDVQPLDAALGVRSLPLHRVARHRPSAVHVVGVERNQAM